MGAIPWGFSYAQGGETMPKKPLRPCSHPGCPNLCEGQFCEQHRVEERRKYDKYERSSDVNRKYGRAWKRIRDRYAAEHPLCEQCLKEGRLTPVQEVHHILPVSKGGTHARDNLMSLCQSCHTKIHHDLAPAPAPACAKRHGSPSCAASMTAPLTALTIPTLSCMTAWAHLTCRPMP